MALIKTYEKLPRFLVTSDGKVLSSTTNKEIKTSIGKGGYLRLSVIVGSRTDNTRKHLNLKIHRMVAETFIPNPKGIETVNHKDGNKLNNNVENLEWMSFSNNTKHAHTTGLMKYKPLTEERKKKLMEARRK